MGLMKKAEFMKALKQARFKMVFSESNSGGDKYLHVVVRFDTVGVEGAGKWALDEMRIHFQTHVVLKDEEIEPRELRSQFLVPGFAGWYGGNFKTEMRLSDETWEENGARLLRDVFGKTSDTRNLHLKYTCQLSVLIEVLKIHGCHESAESFGAFQDFYHRMKKEVAA